MSKEYSYSKGVILFSISRRIELLKRRNEELYQEIEQTNLKIPKYSGDPVCLNGIHRLVNSFYSEISSNLFVICALSALKNLIDDDELLPLPPDNKSFDFNKDEIPFPDDGLPF